VIDRVIGIDFSGARNAGNSIWLAELKIAGGIPRIESCYPAEELPDSGVAREVCLPALVKFIARQGAIVVGCDFPFSLPASMIGAAKWRDFVLGFGERYADAEWFMADCRRHANGRELKRACDRKSRVPFAAYNLRIYRQTFHGIRDFLAPLIREGAATVLPMERRSRDRPWIAETCPASTLKSVDLYPSYKGAGPDKRKARQAIVNGLIKQGEMPALPPAIRRLVIDNKGGDALDSVIAACATARCLKAGQFEELADEISRREGRVYF
jgi:hypothetical protein